MRGSPEQRVPVLGRVLSARRFRPSWVVICAIVAGTTELLLTVTVMCGDPPVSSMVCCGEVSVRHGRTWGQWPGPRQREGPRDSVAFVVDDGHSDGVPVGEFRGEEGRGGPAFCAVLVTGGPVGSGMHRAGAGQVMQPTPARCHLGWW
ncbi:hypothetical protein [Austwickia sp. TVS 96-490-7B]|uniref:hypothetical protein n=1 Tax=Austwickia sp. TVS 96-490-7B TaxID=2830843 RepID=UPI001C596532|nr:hypothetical protein [Austwickia sp. TVS 96-490-7B]